MTYPTVFSRSRLLCGTALVMLSALPAFAQDAVTDEDLTVYSLDPIDMRALDPLGEAADRATSAYVSAAEIERAAMGDLKDLFAGIASVSVGGAIPVAQKLFVNGVDMLNLAIQVDGVSQNNRTFHHASANAFDPGLMKAVRVDPGVAPADAGPAAIAGRVVLETVDAADILDEGATFGGQTRLSYANNGSTKAGSLTLAGRSNGFEVLGYVKRVTGDEYDDGNGDEVSGTAPDINVKLLKLAYESDQGHRVELSSQQMVDDGLRNLRANFGPSANNPVARRYDTTRTVHSLRYENDNGEGFWNPSATVGFSENEVDTLLLLAGSPYDGLRFIGTTRSYNATLQNKFYLSQNNTITAGVDYLDQRSSAESNSQPGNTPFEKSKTFGVFAQARLEPTKRLNVSAGVRYDWNDFTGNDAAQTGNIFEDKEQGASANLSVAFGVTDALSLRAGYSNVFGGYQVEDNFLFDSFFLYNGLETRRGQNIVVGADWTSGGWTLGAEVFRTKLDNVRETGRPVRGVRTVDAYDFEARGVNLGASYDWGSGFARLTYSNSENKVNGENASSYQVLDSGAPLGQVLALQLQQELPQWNMVVGGGVDVALDYDHDPVGDPYAVEEFASYEVVNVFAEYQPPSVDNLVIRAQVTNLFDRVYADRATYGGDYTEGATFATLKEPGRTFSLVLSSKF
ncbi:TonB-dependent receptor domain-containing protein [Thalassobius sp. Cn5-15]|uniref:TonB-dependent receptor domain-containing protein n=1 Tax=Thalassobius sp. Cn5-15 TaxID=2917763 RepID=UPI001EF3122C|nr:TonB-dependent receptor [Thalassobius sp. Cn5-15]MCG7494226.1 TonB-dependent receptor [Thalassobius sp. Cn5-15]